MAMLLETRDGLLAEKATDLPAKNMLRAIGVALPVFELACTDKQIAEALHFAQWLMPDGEPAVCFH